MKWQNGWSYCTQTYYSNYIFHDVFVVNINNKIPFELKLFDVSCCESTYQTWLSQEMFCRRLWNLKFLNKSSNMY